MKRFPYSSSGAASKELPRFLSRTIAAKSSRLVVAKASERHLKLRRGSVEAAAAHGSIKAADQNETRSANSNSRLVGERRGFSNWPKSPLL
jgi:hypothetical protein